MWENEKYYLAMGERPTVVGGMGEIIIQLVMRSAVDAMSVNDLFNTLQSLANELEKMESWI